MTDIQGTNVIAPVRPTNTEAVIPTVHADEIYGGVKFVEDESGLSGSPFIPERRPRGTIASVGIGQFRQWTGSDWVRILQGLSTPTVGSSMTEVWLTFDGNSVSLPIASGTSAGVITSATLGRINAHAARHRPAGGDQLLSLNAASNMAPMGDDLGRIAPGWLYPATRDIAGSVYVADDGESPVDGSYGTPIAVCRANDSRLAQIQNILNQIDLLETPIRFVNSLPEGGAINPQALYWVIPESTLFIHYQGIWIPIAGSNMIGQPGKSAFEIAQDQGFTGTIAEWLAGLQGTDGAPGEDGLSAYELAVLAGFVGSINDWLESMRGEKGEPGDTGLSAYEVAVAEGFQGTLEEWLLTLQGEQGYSAFQLAVQDGFTGTQEEWLESLRGERGERGDGIKLIGYFATMELFRAAGLVGEPGQYYSVAGDLYGWSDEENDWIYMGPLFSADTFSFEYEVWLNQPDNSDKTFEDFLREILINAVDGVDLQAAIAQEVVRWAEENAQDTLQPLVDQWLSGNFSADIDAAVTAWMDENAADLIQEKVDAAIAAGLASQIDAAIQGRLLSHITDYHTWTDMT